MSNRAGHRSDSRSVCFAMSPKHAAPEPDETEAPAPKPLKRSLFRESLMPHWAMLFVTTLYVGFNISVGIAAVPQTISLAFTTTLGAWFTYLVRQRKQGEE